MTTSMAATTKPTLSDPVVRARHYILNSPGHPRRWAAFSPRKVEQFRAKFGNDFCLVVAGDPGIVDDFYALPWHALADYFVGENLLPVTEKRTGRVLHRWQIHLEGPPHHFQMELAPSDTRTRPRIDASRWYGNGDVLGLPPGPPAETGPTAFEDEFSALEGRRVLLRHFRRERNPVLVQEAKRQRLRTSGRLTCEACGFDFFEVYGALGDGFIEAHHTVALRDLAGPTATKSSDLALVCANCHRMLHRGKTWLTVTELRKMLRVAKAG